MAMTDAREKQRSVAIIGAGMSGICTAIKLKEAGITDFTIYEKASEIGGTWRENTYPGCSCDVPLHMYQFSFDMRPDWERKFVFSADIKAYLESVVDKYGLRNHIRFNSEIESCRFDERSGRWHIGCADGSAHEADAVAAGTGQLHRPRWPGIKGEESFEGAHWHSDEWNHEYDLKGKRVFTFPTAGRFLAQFGVVPVTLPWEDIEVAVQTGELDGIAWSGITEDYTVGWADVTNYFLTNNISGAWAGSFFANQGRWNELPEDLQTLFRVCCDQSHYYRQWWYWGGEASLRVNGPKMELTTIPDAEWQQVEDAAVKFWDEIAAESPTKAKVVEIFKKYNADMQKAGRPYRYG